MKRTLNYFLPNILYLSAFAVSDKDTVLKTLSFHLFLFFNLFLCVLNTLFAGFHLSKALRFNLFYFISVANLTAINQLHQLQNSIFRLPPRHNRCKVRFKPCLLSLL